MNPNQNARRLAEARQRQVRRPQTQTLDTTLTETRDDVKWLKRGLQAVLDHLSLDRSGPNEVQRRAHSLLKDPTSPHVEGDRRDGTSVQQLSWQTPQRAGRPPRSRTDTQRPAPGSRSDDERPAAQRLADALGWDHVPQLSEAEQKESDLDLQAAQVQARRLYQQETGEFERGWDTALELAVDLVAGACDGDQAQQWLQRVLHAHTGPEDEPPHQLQPAPLRPAEQLAQPGMLDSDEEPEEFLAQHRRCR